MKSGFDSWWKSDDSVVPFFSKNPIVEGKGLPPGWVSQWGEKKAQKQTDGSWVFVPAGTPTGIQPFLKASVGGAAFGGPAGSFTPTQDDEMVSYLKSINFDDPTQQSALTKSPKFVGDMLKKFGTGWFDKYKKLATTVPTAPVTPTVPSNPIDHALQQLGFAPGSKQAFVVDTLHKTGSQDAAVNAYSKKFGIKYALAFHEVEALVKSGAAKGVFQTSGDWDELKVKLTAVPTLGAVISAPVLAVSAPVSASPLPVATPDAKPKPPKKDKSGITPVSPPELSSLPTVTNPKVIALANKLGFAPGSNQAKVLDIWRKHFKINHFTSFENAAAEIAGLTGASPALEQKYLLDLVKTKVYKLPDWDDGNDFAIDEPSFDDDAKVLAAMAKVKKLGYDHGTLGSFALDSLYQKAGDLEAAAKYMGQPHVGTAEVPYDLALKLVTAAQKMVFNAMGTGSVQYGVDKKIGSMFDLPKGPTKTPAAPEPPSVKPIDVFKGGARSVSSVMKKLGYKGGTTGGQALGLLVVHDGDEAKALAAFQSINPGFTAEFAAKVVSAVRKEMLALGSGSPPPEKDPSVSAILAKPPPKAPTSNEPAVADVNVATAKETTKKGITLPDIPPMVALSYAGDAKVKLGGNKPKKFLKDNGGTLFLHKYGADKIRAAGGEVASNLAAIIAGPGGYVPVKSVETDGDWGTVQPMVPDVSSDLSQVEVTDLTKDQIRQLQRERLIDWVVSNHDSKAANLILTKDGSIFGIDKEQAFKFIGKDVLSLDYSPNPSTPIYNGLYSAYATKKLDLDPNDMLPYIQAVENTPEADWKQAVQPYLDALPEESREEVWASIAARKQNVRQQFEKFFSMLKKKRGEEGGFAFAGVAAPDSEAAKLKKQKKLTGVGILVPPTVPSIASMTYSHVAKIGGAGEKHFFTNNSDGKLWLLKVAANKGTKAAEPWKVASQVLFATIGQAVKPSTPPVGPATYGNKPATVQPWLGDDLKTLSGVAPGTLTEPQKKDVATEHVLDWLLSQHDTHGGNLVIVPETGSVIGIDKEQGFKYMLPSPKWTSSTPDGDKLSIDYHPNAQYGEQEPYYNKFWRAFGEGAMNFDPTAMKGAIEAVEKIPDDEYVKALATYASARYATNADESAKFYAAALTRKQKIRAEFESFLTDLYEKRTKKKGKFTLDGGWVAEGAVVSAPAASAQPVPGAPATALPKYLTPETAKAAGAAIEVEPGSVYWKALSALSKTGSIPLAVAMLTAAQPLAEPLHAKRVKYVHKKLAALGFLFNPPPTPDATGAAPIPGLKSTASPSAVKYAPNKPTAKGALGVLNPAMVFPEGVAPPTAPKKPATPVGFPEPPEGQMWEVSTAAQFAQKHVYKLKTPKDSEGNPDTSSPNAVLKLQGLALNSAKEFLAKLEVTPIQSMGKPLYKEKDGKIIVLVNKDEWEKAKAAKAGQKFSQLVPIPPPEPPPGALDKFKATPKAGELKNPEAVPNLEELVDIHKSKDIGFGAAFFIGGSAIEQQSVSVQRHHEKGGKEFYRFNFKIRQPAWEKFKGGVNSTFSYSRTKYDESEDAWVETSVGGQTTDKIPGMTKWESEGSTLHLGANTSKYAYKGMVFADIYPKPGETPYQAFARILDTMHPGFSKEVLKNPTKEERDLLALSALYWSVAPQEADKLDEGKRTIPELKKRLVAKGYTEEDFSNLGFERIAMDRVAPILKGRHLKLKEKHNLQSIGVGVDTPEKIAKQLASGTIGIVQRLAHGVPVGEGEGSSSPGQDQHSGGADYVYARIDKKSSGSYGWPSGYGSIQMVYDLSELDRLDIYQHQSDHYGCCNPNETNYNSGGNAYKNRTSLEASAGNCFEVMFKRGIASRKLLKIVCSSQSEVQDVIAACKKLGVTKMNGMSLEDFVVPTGTHGANAFYKTHLEPAGY